MENQNDDVLKEEEKTLPVEETAEDFDDSFDEQPLDGEYEEGDSLVGEQYIAPVKDEKFVDVRKGEVVDKKDISPLLQIKALGEIHGQKIGDPKKSCSWCYGRGYINFNLSSQTYTPCTCLTPALTRLQKEELHRKLQQTGMLVTAQDLRKMRRLQKKIFAKKVHLKGLELLKKEAESKKTQTTEAING